MPLIVAFSPRAKTNSAPERQCRVASQIRFCASYVFHERLHVLVGEPCLWIQSYCALDDGNTRQLAASEGSGDKTGERVF